MQDVVVLDVVQQCGRCGFRIAGQEYGNAGHRNRGMIRLLLHHRHEGIKRHIDATGLFEKDRGATFPGPHDDGEKRGHHRRHPAAIMDLQEIGSKENQLEGEQWRQNHNRHRLRPVPAKADEFESHERRDHHRAGHRDAIGGSECFGAFEAENERNHADKQQRVDAGQEDLPRIGLRGEEDLHARQVTEMDRLAHERESTGNHRLAGNDRRGCRQKDDRDQRPFGKHQIEGVAHRFRMLQHHGALA
ncbi:hypothetical protein D3C87_1351450 [compost metagenome]